MASTPAVPRWLRAINIVALLLFLGGAGLHVYSWLGMEELRGLPPAAGAEPFSGMARFNELWELSRVGTALIVAAAGLAVLAAVAAIVVRRRSQS